MQVTQTLQRIAWSLPELSAALGLSIGFLRKEARRGALRTRRIGRRVLVTEADLALFLGTTSEAAAEPDDAANSPVVKAGARHHG